MERARLLQWPQPSARRGPRLDADAESIRNSRQIGMLLSKEGGSTPIEKALPTNVTRVYTLADALRLNTMIDSQAHESRVEKLYSTGIDGFHEYHNGYLNFGLWDRPGLNYEEAAENLIRTAGLRLGLSPESDLLDVGCGMGAQDVLLRDVFRPRSIDALDITRKHIERARERLRRSSAGNDGIRFQHASGVKLPFPDGTFTHVLSIEAPEHFDTREKFFGEAFRVLKPGGVLVITDYSLGRDPRTALDKTIVALASWAWCVPKANLYGNSAFEDKLRRTGFDQVSIADLSEFVIPGYYVEAGRWESLRQMIRIRGLLKGVIGGRVIDRWLYAAYRRGLCRYILVWATKA